MIKSKNNTFGFWAIAIVFLFFLSCFLSCFTKYFWGVGPIIGGKIENQRDLYLNLSPWFLLSILFSSILWHNVKLITIDTEKRAILFKNLFTRISKEYSFHELDGFIDTIIPHDKGAYPYKAIGLVQGKRIVKRIDSYYYSNYVELRNGLNGLKNLGSIKFGFFKRIKMMLNYPVLD